MGRKSDGKKKSKASKAPRRLMGMTLLRMVVRKVINNIAWMRDSFLTPEEIAENLRKRPDQLLTYEDKMLLFLKPRLRPWSELRKIAEKFTNCIAFEGFDLESMVKVFKDLKFEYFKPGRVLIKKGQPPQGMYIIVGGYATTSVDKRYYLFPDRVATKTTYFPPGCKLGDIEMFFNDPREFTIIAGENGLATLRLGSAKFKEVYAPVRLDKQWQLMTESMRIFTLYFQKYSDAGLKRIFVETNFQTFPVGKLLPKISKAGENIALFIVSGTVQVIQRLLVYEESPFKKDRKLYKLYEDQEQAGPLPDNVIQVFMKTVELRPGACVGLGEQVFRHPLMTLTEVQCMIIPVAVLKSYGSVNTLLKVILTMDHACPDAHAMFEAFIDGRQWVKYKRATTKLHAKQFNLFKLSVHDLPLSYRAFNLRLKSDIMARIENDPDYLIGEKPLKKFVPQKYPNIGEDLKKFSKGKPLYSLDDFPELCTYDPLAYYEEYFNNNKCDKVHV